MSEKESATGGASPTVTAAANGPYIVAGGVPLYRRRAIHSEQGEPLTWETTEQLEVREQYALCRCGDSNRKPFCDGTHVKQGFVADDTASGTYDERSKVLGGTDIEVRDDRSICVHAGFCGNKVTNVWKQVGQTDDSVVRSQVIAMIERCPSGALTYDIDGSQIEPLLPEAISVTDDGPLWVTGSIPVSTSDDKQIEARNRVALCRCGASANKPLCDGSHKEAGFSDH